MNNEITVTKKKPNSCLLLGVWFFNTWTMSLSSELSKSSLENVEKSLTFSKLSISVMSSWNPSFTEAIIWVWTTASFCLYFKIQNTFCSVFSIDFLPLSRSICYVLTFIWTCRYMISFLQTMTQLNPRSLRFPGLLGLSVSIWTNFHCHWPLGETCR